jgi:hypothetical protein
MREVDAVGLAEPVDLAEPAGLAEPLFAAIRVSEHLYLDFARMDWFPQGNHPIEIQQL